MEPVTADEFPVLIPENFVSFSVEKRDPTVAIDGHDDHAGNVQVRLRAVALFAQFDLRLLALRYVPDNSQGMPFAIALDRRQREFDRHFPAIFPDGDQFQGFAHSRAVPCSKVPAPWFMYR